MYRQRYCLHYTVPTEWHKAVSVLLYVMWCAVDIIYNDTSSVVCATLVLPYIFLLRLTSYGGSKTAAYSHSTGRCQHLYVPWLILKHTQIHMVPLHVSQSVFNMWSQLIAHIKGLIRNYNTVNRHADSLFKLLRLTDWLTDFDTKWRLSTELFHQKSVKQKKFT